MPVATATTPAGPKTFAFGLRSRMRSSCSAVQWSACSCVITTPTTPPTSVSGMVKLPGSMMIDSSPLVITRQACSYFVTFMAQSLRLPDTPRGYRIGGVIEDLKKRALHRAKILEGQLRGLERMIDDEEYCVDIVTQSLAIQKSLRSLNKLLVENHLRTHVTDMFEAGGDERAKAVDELLKVYELNNNRGGEA